MQRSLWQYLICDLRKDVRLLLHGKIISFNYCWHALIILMARWKKDTDDIGEAKKRFNKCVAVLNRNNGLNYWTHRRNNNYLLVSKLWFYLLTWLDQYLNTASPNSVTVAIKSEEMKGHLEHIWYMKLVPYKLLAHAIRYIQFNFHTDF